ncbi:MAG: hypothetical protein M3044_09880 [Thermoproteota archaeon]|nr:hypothetical protein [Thermoproteota archaeon]
MSGYSGYNSYDADDRYAEAERLRQRDESRKLVIALWPEQMQPNIELPRSCNMCARVLIPYRQDPDKFLFCGDCGSTFPINVPKPKPRTFKPKQNAKPSLIIASQSTKRRRKTPLGSLPSSDDDNQELRRELESLGVIAATAQEVSEY